MTDQHSPVYGSAYQQALVQATGSPFLPHNDIEILHNGVQIFPAMLRAIEQAESLVEFATFVYWTGPIARVFAEALASKAANGCEVRVLLDAFGAKRMPRALHRQMQQSGVSLRWFRPLSSWRVWRHDKRMHRKLLICDGAIAFTGGVGIAGQWEGDARNTKEWRDTQVEVRGPSVLAMRAAFLENWNEAGSWAFEPVRPELPEQSGSSDVQVVRSSSTIGWTDASTVTRTLIAIARTQIVAETAYFNPDERLVEVLLEAIERGVCVQLLLPGKQCDSRMSQLAGAWAVERLGRAGARISFYSRTMLHCKWLVIDEAVTCVGSANFNYRSMGKDEELNLIIEDERVAASLLEKFADDREDSDALNIEEWQRRSLGRKILEKLVRLFKEQL